MNCFLFFLFFFFCFFLFFFVLFFCFLFFFFFVFFFLFCFLLLLFFSFSKYFSLNSFRFLILAFVLSKPIQYESVRPYEYTHTAVLPDAYGVGPYVYIPYGPPYEYTPLWSGPYAYATYGR